MRALSETNTLAYFSRSVSDEEEEIFKRFPILVAVFQYYPKNLSVYYLPIQLAFFHLGHSTLKPFGSHYNFWNKLGCISIV